MEKLHKKATPHDKNTIMRKIFLTMHEVFSNTQLK